MQFGVWTVQSKSGGVEHFYLSTKNKVMEAEGALTEVLEQGSAGERQVAEQRRRS